MGSLIRIQCNNCHEKWSLQTGYGLMHGRIENVAAILPESVAKNLPMEQLRNHEIPWSFAYETALCEDCKTFFSAPIIRYADEQTIPPSACPQCGKSLRLIDEAHLTQTPCPSCGTQNLDITEQGLWD